MPLNWTSAQTVQKQGADTRHLDFSSAPGLGRCMFPKLIKRLRWIKEESSRARRQTCPHASQASMWLKNKTGLGVIADIVAMLNKHLRWCIAASLSQVTRVNPCQPWSLIHPCILQPTVPKKDSQVHIWEFMIQKIYYQPSSIEPINVMLETPAFV